MLELLLWILVQSSHTLPPIREEGIATSYNPFGKDITHIRGKQVNLCPQKLACSWWGYSVRPNDLFLAHRSLPCGMRVLIRNVRTKRVASAVVIDRGTFGANGCYREGSLRCIACNKTGARHGWCVKIYRHEPGTWRGIADLSPALTRELALNGMERIQILYSNQAMQAAREDWRLRRSSVEARRMSWLQRALQIPRLSRFWEEWVSRGLREFVEKQRRPKDVEV